MDDVAVGSIHIRVEGRSYDFDMDELDIGFGSDDMTIKRAVSAALETPVSKLNNYRVEKNELSNAITLYPNASFGK